MPSVDVDPAGELLIREPSDPALGDRELTGDDRHRTGAARAWRRDRRPRHSAPAAGRAGAKVSRKTRSRRDAQPAAAVRAPGPVDRDVLAAGRVASVNAIRRTVTLPSSHETCSSGGRGELPGPASEGQRQRADVDPALVLVHHQRARRVPGDALALRDFEIERRSMVGVVATPCPRAAGSAD